MREAREIMSGEVKEGRLCLSCRIDIKDETGTVVASVPFREALTVSGLQRLTMCGRCSAKAAAPAGGNRRQVACFRAYRGILPGPAHAPVPDRG